jgi:hypothetical protein
MISPTMSCCAPRHAVIANTVLDVYGVHNPMDTVRGSGRGNSARVSRMRTASLRPLVATATRPEERTVSAILTRDVDARAPGSHR